MADKRPTELTTEETTLRGFVHSDDPTNGSRKFDLARIGNALALRQGAPQLISDGSTSGRAIVSVPGTRGALASAVLATRVGFFTVPPSNPASFAHVFNFGTSSAPTSTSDNSILCYIDTSGGLIIRANGTTGGTNNRQSGWAGFLASYAGRTILLEVAFVGGTTKPTVYVNGVDISSFFTQSTNGSAPDWLHASLSAAYSLNGFNWPSGDAPLGCWINAALTDADRTYWLTHGVPPSWVLNGGSMVSMLAGWNFTSGWSTGGAVVINDADTFTTTGAGGVYVTQNLQIGQRYRVTWARTTTAPACELYNAGTATNLIATADGSYEFTAVTGFLYLRNTGSGQTDVSTLELRPLGALGFPVVGPDRFVRDATRISPPIDGYMVGMRPLSTDADGWIRGRRTSSGYLQADTQLVGDGRGVTQVLMRSVSGGTASLGESAGSPATVVASLTLTAGVWTPCTILKSVISTGKLYAALGTATDVEVAVRTGPILSLV